MIKCFWCDDKGEAKTWDKNGIAFILKSLKLCPKHETELTEKLKLMPEVEPDINADVFVPKEVPIQKNYTEREPGEEG